MRIPLLAHFVTVAMFATVVWTAVRWKRLDRGARWIGCGVAVFFGYAIVALSLVITGNRTRIYQEVPFLVGTLCHLIGFSVWQPTKRLRNVVLGAAAVFVIGWAAAQQLQGVDADFSYLSGPLHAVMITAAAGFSMVTRVRVSWDPLTRQVWFWFSVSLMLIYGTEILLVPLMAGAYQIRNDLLRAASLIHLAASLVGYSAMATALWILERPIRGATPRHSVAGTVRQLL